MAIEKAAAISDEDVTGDGDDNADVTKGRRRGALQSSRTFPPSLSFNSTQVLSGGEVRKGDELLSKTSTEEPRTEHRRRSNPFWSVQVPRGLFNLLKSVRSNSGLNLVNHTQRTPGICAKPACRPEPPLGTRSSNMLIIIIIITTSLVGYIGRRNNGRNRIQH